MANLIRVSGTVQTTPNGPTTISSPGSNVNVVANSLNVINAVSTPPSVKIHASGNVGQAIITLSTTTSFIQPGIIVTNTVTNTLGTSATVVSVAGTNVVLNVANSGTFVNNELTFTDTGAGKYSPSGYSISISNDGKNVGNRYNHPFNPEDIYDTTENRQKGAVYIAGGLGVEKDMNVGGFIYGRIAEAVTSTQLVVNSTNTDQVFYPLFVDTLAPAGPGAGVHLFGDETPSSTTTYVTTASQGFTYNPAKGRLSVEEIYANVLSTFKGKLEIVPEGGVTEVVGDIRVLGQNPIGTAPVVTNVLYVTMDGDDTNDGRAQDPSRACRTITGAVNSPYYQSGTQIKVSPGHYLEDNPIRLKPYTSIMGSDIRTTGIEPINKTQDLFHLESGCYLAFMQFLNGRSGLLDGPYAAGFNRGAYCTAFPPLEGDERIDLFHSPYVQNCTNMTGPWLKDGTLFTPNQTVQVPLAVGTGTWAANTTSIVINVSTGTIEQGMTINAGQQNPGFFNARTLMLANKPFLQEQVVAYVNQTFPTFEYSQEKCFRDVAILVENVAYDAAFGGNQKSIESGLAYWDGVVSRIAGQETQTTSATTYLNSLIQDIIVNNTCTDLLSGSGEYSQVINTVLVGGDIAGSAIDSLFGIINNIIINGPSAAPNFYTSTGPDAAFVSAEILMQANRSFIQEDTINFINQQVKEFPYNKEKCRRDIRIIIDSIASDMAYPTANFSQSNFAGLQYWAQESYVGLIPDEITTTTAAVSYLKELSAKIVKNVTVADDAIVGVTRYSGAVQDTSIEAATDAEVAIINQRFDEILEIIGGNNKGWTDKIIPNRKPSNFISVQHAYDLLIANKNYFKTEVIAFITAEYPSFSYDQVTCERDIGYMIDSIAFDLLHGGNRQSIQAGLCYYSFNNTTSNIVSEIPQTVSAFNYLADLISDVVQNIPVITSQTSVTQNISLTTATLAEVATLSTAITTITNIITSGPTAAAPLTPISLIGDTSTNVTNAYDIIVANKEFLAAEVIARVDREFNPNSFMYDESKCYRDVGLIIDAVSQDILLGGNQRSIEAGLSYWNKGYNHVAGQESTTTMAINYARDLALDIIANTPVTPQTATVSTQVINNFFQYGGDYMPQEAVSRNFYIITNIIENGPHYAPPVYAGGGVFALTGINGLDVKIAPTVTSVSEMSTGTYLVGLSTSTIGFGNNATLYFGDTLVFPYQDSEVEALSMELTGDSTTWNQRKVDPIGGMGGSLVDGAVISERSPIQSFVYDAFTQLSQGGRGIHITNDGYAQLVSVFTIFSSVGVQTDNGGIASIVNSNANFGDICLLAKGYGKRKFSGTVYNPPYKAYPPSPGEDGFDQYFPFGYWPNNARVEIFTPDIDDRPHISLVMEVVPPDNYIDVNGNTIPFLNDQGLPGFLNASPTKATLSTGTIVITDINTDGIAVGNTVYIRDQNNSFRGDDGNLYADTGTVVTDVGYRSITLNKALTSGGVDPEFGADNTSWFNLYFCGNSYYTVLSSEVANNPREAGTNILSVSTVSGITVDQVGPHIDALQYLNNVVDQIIDNQVITPSAGNTLTQFVDAGITGGIQAQTFIDLRFTEMTNIIGAASLAAAEAVIPKRLRDKKGTVSAGAGSAIKLIEANIDFLSEEVAKYVINLPANASLVGTYNTEKCKRDIGLVLQRLIYDLKSGGRYNCVMTGLSYWSRTGTHHIVQLGENVRRNDLFPDGATVNFYQRSYISASGYVFEYVGAGTNYGALPQQGIKDPVQGKETVQLDSGKVFFTSTDQNGDFRIGPGLVISQATGVLSGRTFTKSLFANMTPFILAIEGAGL